MHNHTKMGVRRFGRVNWLGLLTLIEREVRRFTSVWTQTLLAPLATALLFMAVFTLALGARRGEIMGVPFAAFLAPGIMMMSVIQNAFTNTSSSLLVSKIQGNIVDTLMPPLSPAELLVGFTIGGVFRGFAVAVGIGMVVFPIIGIWPEHLFWLLGFVVVGSAMMALLGTLAGIISRKFDHLAAITNFIITPLSFLSGTFYTSENLPDFFRMLMQVNPVFYLIDGARYGVIGMSDSNPLIGLGFVLAIDAVLAWWVYSWLKSGYALKS